MTQPSLFDSTTAIDTYQARYAANDLTPGEACPACGHVFPGTHDATRDHGLVTDGMCVGMELTRRHLALDIQAGLTNTAAGIRACEQAGWPAAVIRGWLDQPATLTSTLHPDRTRA